jgi:hypothetical protein
MIMEVKALQIKHNDYAVAKALNNHVAGLIIYVILADSIGLAENYAVEDINKAYVLLSDELQRLYKRNPELDIIVPEPVWKRFDVLEASTWEINEYFEDPMNTEMQAHIARVNRLCIISGVETPNFSPEQSKLIAYTNKVSGEYGVMLQRIRDDRKAEEENDWYIPEYTLTYDTITGAVVINGVLRLNKKSTQDDSNVDRLLKQALAQPNTLITPNLNATKRNISTILSAAGFDPVLKSLFFRTARKDKGVFCRPVVTRAVADAEKIETTELDLKLKRLGAVTQSGKSS